jgi:hypothetical protein
MRVRIIAADSLIPYHACCIEVASSNSLICSLHIVYILIYAVPSALETSYGVLYMCT